MATPIGRTTAIRQQSSDENTSTPRRVTVPTYEGNIPSSATPKDILSTPTSNSTTVGTGTVDYSKNTPSSIVGIGGGSARRTSTVQSYVNTNAVSREPSTPAKSTVQSYSYGYTDVRTGNTVDVTVGPDGTRISRQVPTGYTPTTITDKTGRTYLKKDDDIRGTRYTDVMGREYDIRFQQQSVPTFEDIEDSRSVFRRGMSEEDYLSSRWQNLRERTSNAEYQSVVGDASIRQDYDTYFREDFKAQSIYDEKVVRERQLQRGTLPMGEARGLSEKGIILGGRLQNFLGGVLDRPPNKEDSTYQFWERNQNNMLVDALYNPRNTRLSNVVGEGVKTIPAFTRQVGTSYDIITGRRESTRGERITETLKIPLLIGLGVLSSTPQGKAITQSGAGRIIAGAIGVSYVGSVAKNEYTNPAGPSFSRGAGQVIYDTALVGIGRGIGIGIQNTKIPRTESIIIRGQGVGTEGGLRITRGGSVASQIQTSYGQYGGVSRINTIQPSQSFSIGTSTNAFGTFTSNVRNDGFFQTLNAQTNKPFNYARYQFVSGQGSSRMSVGKELAFSQQNIIIDGRGFTQSVRVSLQGRNLVTENIYSTGQSLFRGTTNVMPSGTSQSGFSFHGTITNQRIGSVRAFMLNKGWNYNLLPSGRGGQLSITPPSRTTPSNIQDITGIGTGSTNNIISAIPQFNFMTSTQSFTPQNFLIGTTSISQPSTTPNVPTQTFTQPMNEIRITSISRPSTSTDIIGETQPIPSIDTTPNIISRTGTSSWDGTTSIPRIDTIPIIQPRTSTPFNFTPRLNTFIPRPTGFGGLGLPSGIGGSRRGFLPFNATRRISKERYTPSVLGILADQPRRTRRKGKKKSTTKRRLSEEEKKGRFINPLAIRPVI